MITGRATETGWSLMRSARRSVSGTKNISSSIRHQNFKKMQKLKVEKLKVILALYMGSTGYICEPLLKGAWRRSVSGTAWGSCSGEKHCFFTIITMITIATIMTITMILISGELLRTERLIGGRPGPVSWSQHWTTIWERSSMAGWCQYWTII